MFYEMPYAVLYTVFFVAGFGRGHLTYSIAKYFTEHAVLGRQANHRWVQAIQGWLQSPRLASGTTMLHRYGLIAVPACYLTIGLQTVVLAAAGVIGMPRLKFALAQLPGVAVWAAIYSTIGWAAWEAMITQAATSWIGIAVLVALLSVVVMLVIQRRLKQAAASNRSRIHPTDPAGNTHQQQ
ncbi:DedA family protein [Corynebacterium choanae]|nr:hypothetical protein [Corynebacterium choanae]